MNITARVENMRGEHRVTVQTNGQEKSIAIPAKAEGLGSAVNGGELLFLALATCYCNDLYREAVKRGVEVSGVEVTLSGDFGYPGEPARNIEYRTRVDAAGSREDILALIRHTDTVAEIQNTLRQGSRVTLVDCEVNPI